MGLRRLITPGGSIGASLVMTRGVPDPGYAGISANIVSRLLRLARSGLGVVQGGSGEVPGALGWQKNVVFHDESH